MRHAKSSWSDSSLSDFERPLNERGRRAAPFMGELIVREGLLPDHVVSSPSKRTKETVELVVIASEYTGDICFDSRIFEATVGELMEVLVDLPDTAERALVVGHNPASEQIVQTLTGAMEAMPTAALAVIDLKVDSWANIAPGSGELKRFFRPRDEARRVHGVDEGK